MRVLCCFSVCLIAFCCCLCFFACLCLWGFCGCVLVGAYGLLIGFVVYEFGLRGVDCCVLCGLLIWLFDFMGFSGLPDCACCWICGLFTVVVVVFVLLFCRFAVWLVPSGGFVVRALCWYFVYVCGFVLWLWWLWCWCGCWFDLRLVGWWLLLVVLFAVAVGGLVDWFCGCALIWFC